MGVGGLDLNLLHKTRGRVGALSSKTGAWKKGTVSYFLELWIDVSVVLGKQKEFDQGAQLRLEPSYLLIQQQEMLKPIWSPWIRAW